MLETLITQLSQLPAFEAIKTGQIPNLYLLEQHLDSEITAIAKALPSSLCFISCKLTCAAGGNLPWEALDWHFQISVYQLSETC